MKRLLTSTAALSVALMHIQPWPLTAQTLTDTGAVIAVDGTVLCEPGAEQPCDVTDPDLVLQAQQIEAEIAAAAAEAQAQADADAAAAEAEAQAQTDADAAAAAEAEAQAQTDADAAAAAEAEAQAQADADAAAAAEAEAQAQADADAAAAEAGAQAQADADAAAAEAEAQAQADADAAAAAEAEAQARADADAAAAAAQAEAQAQTDADAAADTEAATVIPEENAIPQENAVVDPAAGLKTAAETLDPAAAPVEAPEVSATEMQSLSDLLSGAAAALNQDTAEPAQPIAAAGNGAQPADAAPSTDAVTATTETVTETTTRSALQEFAAAPQVVAPGKKNKLSDLEKAGLAVLGALAVGTILNNANKDNAAQGQQQVISNTGDRVVVQQPDGTYQVLKDDDTLLRRPGNTLRTETFQDGSSRTIVDRGDGSQVVTIRNATGRVLRRAVYDTRGNESVLFNDLAAEQPVVVSNLPKPRTRPIIISNRDGDAAIKAALAKRQIQTGGRSYSLRQVREIPQVRHLAAMIEVNNITFASGSSALSITEIDALADLGDLMQDLLNANPAEVFLIEGHTDATGSAALNLALSDRRAETVALAMTEYFAIPPENMVVQGYGETELLIDTQADEKRNRRAAVRIISPLL